MLRHRYVRALVISATLLIGDAQAQPPPLDTGTDFRFWLQPEEVLTITCDFLRPLSSATVDVLVRKGVDPGAVALADAIVTEGSKARVRVVGTGRPLNTVYQLHILGTTTDEDVVACDVRCDLVEIRFRP